MPAQNILPHCEFENERLELIMDLKFNRALAYINFIVCFQLILITTACTNYYNTSYIRIKQQTLPEQYRVYFGSQEAIKYGLDDTPELRKILEPHLKELGACVNGFKFIPDTLSGNGPFQPSFLIECLSP
jgi:hypothetical protein